MTRLTPLAVVFAFAVNVHAAEPEKDFKPLAVEGEDVAAVTAQKQPRGTKVRVRLLERGRGEAIRIGVARTMEAGVSVMTVWDSPTPKVTISENVAAEGFVAIAAGPKETPVKLEKIEADPATANATNLTFEGGMVVQVLLVPPRAPASRPQP